MFSLKVFLNRAKIFISNITLDNVRHFVVGHYRVFIKNQYSKHFNDTKIDDVMFKVAQCPDCYMIGECQHCFCSAEEMFHSDKPCPKGKF